MVLTPSVLWLHYLCDMRRCMQLINCNDSMRLKCWCPPRLYALPICTSCPFFVISVHCHICWGAKTFFWCYTDALLCISYALYTILQCEISLPNIVLHNVVTGNFPFFKYLRQVCHPYFYAPKHDLRTFVTGNVLHILYGLTYAFVCMCYGQLWYCILFFMVDWPCMFLC